MYEKGRNLIFGLNPIYTRVWGCVSRLFVSGRGPSVSDNHPPLNSTNFRLTQSRILSWLFHRRLQIAFLSLPSVPTLRSPTEEKDKKKTDHLPMNPWVPLLPPINLPPFFCSPTGVRPGRSRTNSATLISETFRLPCRGSDQHPRTPTLRRTRGVSVVDGSEDVVRYWGDSPPRAPPVSLVKLLGATDLRVKRQTLLHLSRKFSSEGFRGTPEETPVFHTSPKRLNPNIPNKKEYLSFSFPRSCLPVLDLLYLFLKKDT